MKVLQALLDSILLAAGAVELNHTDTTSKSSAATQADASAKALAERLDRPTPRPYTGEPVLRASVKKAGPK